MTLFGILGMRGTCKSLKTFVDANAAKLLAATAHSTLLSVQKAPGNKVRFSAVETFRETITKTPPILEKSKGLRESEIGTLKMITNQKSKQFGIVTKRPCKC